MDKRMTREALRSRRLNIIVPAVMLAVFFIQASYIAWEKSSTWDEPTHLLSGYARLKGGATRASLHHPALGQIIIAAPAAAFLDLDFDPAVNFSYPNGHFFSSSAAFLYGNKVDARRLLFLARLPNIVLAATLGLYVFIWSKKLWGPEGGLLALFFFMLSPDVLAHASVATTDLPIAAFFFIAGYYLYLIYADGASFRRVIIGAVFAGCAFASKFTAVLIIPFIFFVFTVVARRDGPRRGAAAFAVYALVIYALVWAIYGFSYPAVSDGGALPWEAFPPSALTSVFAFMREIRFLPEAHLYSLAGTLLAAGGGSAGFLMGEYSSAGWWYYFIVAFLLKTPVATIFLLIAAFSYSVIKTGTRARALALILPPALIVIAASSQRVNIGIRHILPVYPFVFTLIGFVPNIKTESMRVARGVFATALVWYVFAAASIFPHDLAYFNEFAGGPANGSRFLVDSNLDWGQDLRGLKEFMDERGISRIKLAYFGLSDPSYYGIDYEYMPSYVLLDWKGAMADIPLKGWFAVSATMLQGVYLEQHDFYKVFRDATPVARIGYSIYVYDFN